MSLGTVCLLIFLFFLDRSIHLYPKYDPSVISILGEHGGVPTEAVIFFDLCTSLFWLAVLWIGNRCYLKFQRMMQQRNLMRKCSSSDLV